MNINKLCLSFLFCLVIFNLNASVLSTKFDGIKTAEGIKLTWNVKGESLCTHFIIEKSKDGISFKTAATLPISKRDKEREYTYIDRGEKGERIFYRLVEINQDGSGVPSESIVFSEKNDAKFDLKRAIAVSDKAYKGNFFCHTAGTFNYRIMTNMGELLKEGNIEVKEGLNDIFIGLEEVPVGVHLIAFKLENDIEIFKTKRANSGELSKDNFARKQ